MMERIAKPVEETPSTTICRQLNTSNTYYYLLEMLLHLKGHSNQTSDYTLTSESPTI